MIKGGNIGAMDVELVIQSQTATYDAETNETIAGTWVDLATVWAEKLKDPDSMERFEGNQQVALKTYSFRIRYRSDVTELMRVKRGTEVTYIKGIEEADREKFLVLTTEKRDNG